jgi:hypothetical protein
MLSKTTLSVDSLLRLHGLLILVLIIFLLDMMTSVGVALSILYVIPVYLATWSRPPWNIIVVAAVSTVLTTYSYFFSPSGGIPKIAAINHFLVVVALLITAVLALRHNQLSEEIKTLHGLLKMCTSCKNILNEEGEWTPLEVYIGTHSEAAVTHSVCSRCKSEYREKLAAQKHYAPAQTPTP